MLKPTDSVTNIVFLDRETITSTVTIRPPAFPHRLICYDRTDQNQVIERLIEADIAITNKVELREEKLKHLPRLRLIAIAATGSDNIDKESCRKRGITVTNIQDYASITVPEHVITAMLTLRRNILQYRKAVLEGQWQQARQFCFHDYPINDLAGAKLGIIGGGTIGLKVAQLSRALGMEVCFSGRKGNRDAVALNYRPFDEIIRTSDIISIHCPLTPQTKGLLGWKEFTAMERKPIIINTARGQVIIEEDLERALETGLVSGAALDVTMTEPPAHDATIMRLASLSNVLVTPHIAWASKTAQSKLAEQLVKTIEDFMKGIPTNCLV